MKSILHLSTQDSFIRQFIVFIYFLRTKPISSTLKIVRILEVLPISHLRVITLMGGKLEGPLFLVKKNIRTQDVRGL